jgi:putative redox protein
MKSIPSSKVVLSTENYKAVAVSRNFSYPIDTLLKKGGQDSAPTPVEYFLSGIASCVAMTIRMYAEKMKWDLGIITVEVFEKTELTSNGIQKSIIENISIENEMDEEQIIKIKEVSEKCPVALMVKNKTTFIKNI